MHQLTRFLSFVCRIIQNRFFVVLFVLGVPLQVNSATKYSFGVFPYLPSQRMVEIYGPVASDIGQELKATVRLKTASNFNKFESNLAHEIYDIALIQPFDYPAAVDQHHYLPVARLSSDLVTEFVVRVDSGYKTLSDLFGKRIAFPSNRAAISQMGLTHLQHSGINPQSDVRVTFQKTHESCLQQVWLNKAAACVSTRPMINMFEYKRGVKFKTLSQAEIIPHALYVVHQRVPADKRQKLQDVILSWNVTQKGKKMIKAMGFSGFAKVKDEQYDIMRQIIQHNKEKKDTVIDQSSYLSKKQLPFFTYSEQTMAASYGQLVHFFNLNND